MSGNTTIHGVGFVLGVPGGVYGESIVTTDNHGNVTAVNNVPVVSPLAGSLITLSSPPATTTPYTDTPVTFSQTAQHLKVQNTSPYPVHYAYDAVATPDSLSLLPNEELLDDTPVTVLHLYTSASVAINGTSAGNIVIEGRL